MTERDLCMTVGRSAVGVDTFDSVGRGGSRSERASSSWRANRRDSADGWEVPGCARGVIAPDCSVASVDVEASRSLTSSAGLNDSTEDAAVGGTVSSCGSDGVELTSGKMKAS